jgi:hypothetical protein
MTQVSLAEFARLASLHPSDVTALIRPQAIVPDIIGGHKVIDTDKYPPEDFKKKV